ncbi:MAG TPA: fumarylacetoacetate hydrolase family protein [Clostridia bacterium]|nr:MAG: Ureidoglycolate lyase [Firmicutes bacterium ADurb.Bin356]HOR13575.1 fumarylacetoacetate hydrolase family protein [Clostridia bacterium]
MKLCRAANEKETFYAQIEGDVLKRLRGDLFDELRFDGREYPLSEVRLLAPVMPSKIVCLGKNYVDHAMEVDEVIPDEPLLFLKPPSSVIDPESEILWPKQSRRVDFEAELAVVIGETCKDVQLGEASKVIFGYTCLNDVTARDLQGRDGQWTRSKSFDTFCPIGPWIETELDPNNLRVQSRLNGTIKQDASTASLIFNVDRLVHFITQVMTLVPGDIIATGTPAGIGPMRHGDIVEVEVQGIGILRNKVIKP